MSNRETVTPTSEEQNISRRELLGKGLNLAIGGAILSGIGAVLFRTCKSDFEEWQAEEEERKRTSGFEIQDINSNTKHIRLLDSGKYRQEDPLAPSENIRDETINAALSQLAKSCEIESTTAVTERSGFGSATSSLIVQVSGCK